MSFTKIQGGEEGREGGNCKFPGSFTKLGQLEFLKFKVPITNIEAFDGNINGDFVQLNMNLNSAKSKLDCIKPPEYFKLMAYMDTYLNVKKIIKREFNMQVCTNASIKMYELIVQMGLCRNDMTIFCNAELPGAFLCTINHYMKTHGYQYKAFASSYLPETSDQKDNTLLPDKYGIYERHRDIWLMGKPYKFVKKDGVISGDVTDIDVLKEFEQTVEADLYTSDAGIDVTEDYNEQENMTLFINFGQILSGLMTLKEGGKLVTKQYTFFNPFNRSILIVLSYLFKRLYITKPLTSRPANSELYIVGDEFIKERFSDELKERLLNALKMKDSTPLCKLTIESELFECAKEINEQQVEFLNELSSVYKANSAEYIKHVYKFNDKKIKELLSLNKFKKINTSDYL
jgi:hypothetical protein